MFATFRITGNAAPMVCGCIAFLGDWFMLNQVLLKKDVEKKLLFLTCILFGLLFFMLG
jgi:hypothetical protein